MTGTTQTQPKPLVSPAVLARHIDHTKLTFTPEEDTPQTQEAAIRHLCEEAMQFGFVAVCVRPQFVPLCKEVLQGASIQVATVIGFPQCKIKLEDELANPTVGNIPLAEKLAEVQTTVAQGVDELDLVINVAQFKQDLKTGQQATLQEFQTIQQAAGKAHVKVIIETDLLTEEEIQQAAYWCAEAATAMVKTSTGMVEGGAGGTLEAVTHIQKALRQYQKAHPQASPLGIKASGGIKTLSQAVTLLHHGVSRLGTSSGVSLMHEALELTTL